MGKNCSQPEKEAAFPSPASKKAREKKSVEMPVELRRCLCLSNGKRLGTETIPIWTVSLDSKS